MGKPAYILNIEALIAAKTILQKEEGVELLDHFRLTYESLKPVNLIKSNLEEIRTLPNSRAEILLASVRFAAQRVMKRANEGKVAGPLLTVGSTLLEMVIARKMLNVKSQRWILVAFALKKILQPSRKAST